MQEFSTWIWENLGYLIKISPKESQSFEQIPLTPSWVWIPVLNFLYFTSWANLSCFWRGFSSLCDIQIYLGYNIIWLLCKKFYLLLTRQDMSTPNKRLMKNFELVFFFPSKKHSYNQIRLEQKPFPTAYCLSNYLHYF